MDYWRKKYLIPAIREDREIAMIGIGDLDSYLQWNEDERTEKWDVSRLHDSGIRYDIYDISESVVRKAQALGIRAHVLDVTKRPLNKKYDVVFAGDVIEHTDSPIAFVSNISKSLKKGGTMVITAPNALYWRQFIKIEEFHDHIQGFNTVHFQNIARILKLEIIELASFQTNPNKQDPIHLVSHWISVLLSNFQRANSLIFVAQNSEHHD